jgi:hypothetical protein
MNEHYAIARITVQGLQPLLSKLESHEILAVLRYVTFDKMLEIHCYQEGYKAFAYSALRLDAQGYFLPFSTLTLQMGEFETYEKRMTVISRWYAFTRGYTPTLMREFNERKTERLIKEFVNNDLFLK